MPALKKDTTRSMWRAQRGMSLVELMVGITVGLFIVAAAATLMANQLSDNRKLLIEMQIQQDLRASMDIITRQLRRAGAVTVVDAQAGLGTATGAGGSRSEFATVTPATGASSEVGFDFYRGPSDPKSYGFKLEANAIKTLVGAGWQELTDINVMRVTAFTVTPVVVNSVVLPCPKLCADGTAACWPKLLVRDYTVDITAVARNDATVRRTMSSTVRLRNDFVQFNGVSASSPICPV